jgi:hypothetical protein
MTSRAMIQFNNFLPSEGPDADVMGKLEVGKPIAFLPANKTVEDGETLDVLGIKMQFLTQYMSDDYNLTVYVPEKGLVMNNFFWPGTPNIYTLRGGVYRDPLVWRDGLKVIRDLQPEILANTHTRAIVGKDEVMKRLTGYMDQLTLTYDQTLRGMLAGMGPDQLRHAIYIPEHMQEIPENAQSYGETIHFPAAIYQYAIGWFTRFALVTIRTFYDAGDPDDLAKAHAAQDKITVSGGGKGPFEAPNWDTDQLTVARKALSDLSTLGFDSSYAFGSKEEVRPIDHLVGTAAGWGGMPRTAAFYLVDSVEENDGKTPHVVTVKDVPVDAFWSITVYNADGYFEKNDLGRNSFNNSSAKPNEDGSYTFHFGGRSGEHQLPAHHGGLELRDPHVSAAQGDSGWCLDLP